MKIVIPGYVLMIFQNTMKKRRFYNFFCKKKHPVLLQRNLNLECHLSTTLGGGWNNTFKFLMENNF